MKSTTVVEDKLGRGVFVCSYFCTTGETSVNDKIREECFFVIMP